jgi:tetratricopeptide (TPR) repeat protein
VTARNLLALGAVQRGDFAEAELVYQESLARQPRQHRVLGALGGLALRENDLDGAQKLYEQGLAVAPTYVEAMSNLGIIVALRGDESGARRWYEKAIALDPTYPHVNRRLADLFYDRKEYGRALDYYQRALAAFPGFFAVLIQAGNAARYLGESPRAAHYYGEAARVRPDSWIPSYNLACLQALDGEPDAALASLAVAVERGFDSVQLLDDNDDFMTLRTLPGWAALQTKVEEAHARRHAY